jgi:hypothetical protein
MVIHLWRLNDSILLFDLSLPMTYALYLLYLKLYSYAIYICESLAKYYLSKPIHIQLLS